MSTARFLRGLGKGFTNATLADHYDDDDYDYDDNQLTEGEVVIYLAIGGIVILGCGIYCCIAAAHRACRDRSADPERQPLVVDYSNTAPSAPPPISPEAASSTPSTNTSSADAEAAAACCLTAVSVFAAAATASSAHHHHVDTHHHHHHHGRHH